MHTACTSCRKTNGATSRQYAIEAVKYRSYFALFNCVENQIKQIKLLSSASCASNENQAGKEVSIEADDNSVSPLADLMQCPRRPTDTNDRYNEADVSSLIENTSQSILIKTDNSGKSCVTIDIPSQKELDVNNSSSLARTMTDVDVPICEVSTRPNSNFECICETASFSLHYNAGPSRFMNQGSDSHKLTLNFGDSSRGVDSIGSLENRNVLMHKNQSFNRKESRTDVTDEILLNANRTATVKRIPVACDEEVCPLDREEMCKVNVFVVAHVLYSRVSKSIVCSEVGHVGPLVPLERHKFDYKFYDKYMYSRSGILNGKRVSEGITSQLKDKKSDDRRKSFEKVIMGQENHFASGDANETMNDELKSHTELFGFSNAAVYLNMAEERTTYPTNNLVRRRNTPAYKSQLDEFIEVSPAYRPTVSRHCSELPVEIGEKELKTRVSNPDKSNSFIKNPSTSCIGGNGVLTACDQQPSKFVSCRKHNASKQQVMKMTSSSIIPRHNTSGLIASSSAVLSSEVVSTAESDHGSQYAKTDRVNSTTRKEYPETVVERASSDQFPPAEIQQLFKNLSPSYNLVVPPLETENSSQSIPKSMLEHKTIKDDVSVLRKERLPVKQSPSFIRRLYRVRLLLVIFMLLVILALSVYLGYSYYISVSVEHSLVDDIVNVLNELLY